MKLKFIHALLQMPIRKLDFMFCECKLFVQVFFMIIASPSHIAQSSYLVTSCSMHGVFGN